MRRHYIKLRQPSQRKMEAALNRAENSINEVFSLLGVSWHAAVLETDYAGADRIAARYDRILAARP
jgi:hypothetical protein